MECHIPAEGRFGVAMNGTTSRGSRLSARAGRLMGGRLAGQGEDLAPAPQESWLAAGSADLAALAVAAGAARVGFQPGSGEAAAFSARRQGGSSFTVKEFPWGI